MIGIAAHQSAASQAAPGVLGFLVVAGMGIILYFVFKSMARHLRKISVTTVPAGTPTVPAGASPAGVAPAGGGAGSAGLVSTGAAASDQRANTPTADGPVVSGTVVRGTVVSGTPGDGTVVDVTVADATEDGSGNVQDGGSATRS